MQFRATERGGSVKGAATSPRSVNGYINRSVGHNERKMATVRKEMAFAFPRDNAPSGMFVKVAIPPGFGGTDKYKRVNALARLIYDAAYGWVDIEDLLAKRPSDGRLYVDECALVALLVSQSCAQSIDELRRVESIGRVLMHLANPAARIPLTDLDRSVLGKGPLVQVTNQSLAQRPYVK